MPKRLFRGLEYMFSTNKRIFLRKMSVSKSSSPFTICVEGNIASGKTTLLNHFALNPDIHVVSEPVEKWRDLEGENLFEKYYSNPRRWSYTFQSYVQLTMLQNQIKQNNNCIVKLLERSIHSARHIFVENLYRSGMMEICEYNILDEWYNWLVENESISIDLIVYLRTDPDIIYKRLQARCRKEEKVIKIEYLQSIHDLYEDWLILNQHTNHKSNILVLDCNMSQEKLISKYEELYTTNILPIIKQRKCLTNKMLEFKS